MFLGGYRTAAASSMKHFVIIVNGWKPLIIITKSSIFDVATVIDLAHEKGNVRSQVLIDIQFSILSCRIAKSTWYNFLEISFC